MRGGAYPSWLSWGPGILALLTVAALAVWHGARWNRRLVLVGAAMIYLGYGLTYIARDGLVTGGRWTEAKLIYRYATRYHVLPLIGLAAVLAAVLAAWRPIRRCDARRGLPALVGAVVGLMMFGVQRHEVNTWCWLLGYSDQRPTLAALDHVRRVACEEDITRAARENRCAGTKALECSALDGYPGVILVDEAGRGPGTGVSGSQRS